MPVRGLPARALWPRVSQQHRRRRPSNLDDRVLADGLHTWCADHSQWLSAQLVRLNRILERTKGGARPGGHPDAFELWGIFGVRSLREAVMNAQPLLGMSAGTRGRSSQPPVPHEN